MERPSRPLQKQEENSESSLDLSTDSDSDDVFLDKDEAELMHSDDDTLGLEMEMAGFDRRAPSGRKTVAKVQSHSDEDF